MPSRRRCVLKQLKPVSVDPSIQTLVQERFQREAAILETLGELSDQIPRLYAYFTEAHQYYLVQELITGRTLAEIVQAQGPLSETAVLNILLSLLPIIDLIHQRGIIHRDIKPENIMVRDQDGKPVLIDFGAVKETLGTVVNAQGQPMSSVVIGTPGFMSTEQSRGFPTYASDLYSLGLTAIYLLTGKFPHELEIDPQTSQLRWHPDVLQISPGLAVVLDRAIGLVARDRYATATEFLQALHSPTIHSGTQTPFTYPEVPPVPEGGSIHPTFSDPPGERLLPTNIAPDSPTTFTPKKVGILSGIAVVSAVVSFVAVQQMWPLIEGLFALRQVDPTPVPTETIPSVSPNVSPSPDIAATPSPTIPLCLVLIQAHHLPLTLCPSLRRSPILSPQVPMGMDTAIPTALMQKHAPCRNVTCERQIVRLYFGFRMPVVPWHGRHRGLMVGPGMSKLRRLSQNPCAYVKVMAVPIVRSCCACVAIASSSNPNKQPFFLNTDVPLPPFG